MAEAHISPLKDQYPITVRVMGLVATLLLVAMFLVFPRFLTMLEFQGTTGILIEQIDIPLTQQLEQSAPPARPVF